MTREDQRILGDIIRRLRSGEEFTPDEKNTWEEMGRKYHFGEYFWEKASEK